MRILVLGAAGVIGSAVVRQAMRDGHETHALVRGDATPERLAPVSAEARIHRLDLRDRAGLTHLVAELAPDAIVQAAFPPVWGRDPSSRERLLAEGLGLSAVLSEALRARRYVGTLVQLGSATVYGPTHGAHDPHDRLAPNTFRGVIKAAEGLLLAQCATEIGFRLAELRVFTAYGPWEQRGRLVPSLMCAALTASPISLTARPHARDWIHVDDVASACLVAARSASHAHAVHNLCTGRIVDTHQLALEAERITGCTLVRDHAYADRDAYGNENPLGVPPTDRASFDWTPRYSLTDGLAQTWEWARSAAGRRYLLAEPVNA
ncbi:MAG: NAD-dependent epimerase/dehydratase family protein [Panacagrimonas sp.]